MTQILERRVGLRIENARKTYGDRVALEGLSLEVEPGEVFGLLGPNGAGKTTTVHLAVGLLEPDSGSIAIGELGTPAEPPVRRLIGVAPQALSLYEELSAEENLSFFASIHGLGGAELKENVDWALEFVGLGDRRKDRVGTFSGGMKRRLNLAIAIVHRPSLLLLDEPTVGVDPQSRNAIFESIESLRDEGKTIVYTTHYMEEAQRLCERVGILDRGKLLALDTVDNLIRSHGGSSLLIVETEKGEMRRETDDPLEELKGLEKEHSLNRFRVETPTLESVFLKLTGRALRD